MEKVELTEEEAIEIIRQPDRIGCVLIKGNDEESIKYNQQSIEAINMALKALYEKSRKGKGKWVDGRCNKCGEKEPLAYCGTQLISVESKYCPHCGIEMEIEV